MSSLWFGMSSTAVPHREAGAKSLESEQKTGIEIETKKWRGFGLHPMKNHRGEFFSDQDSKWRDREATG